MRIPYDRYRHILLVSVICISGCATFKDCSYRLIQHERTRQAWHANDSGFLLLFSYSSDYRAGWKAGFHSVLTGGDGRPPVIPPRKYWDPPLFFHADTCGQEEWFQGFRNGACRASKHADYHTVRPFLSQPSCNVCVSHGISSEANAATSSIRLLGTITPAPPSTSKFSHAIPLKPNERPPDFNEPWRELSPRPERNTEAGQKR